MDGKGMRIWLTVRVVDPEFRSMQYTLLCENTVYVFIHMASVPLMG